jgi:hypothetical protein
MASGIDYIFHTFFQQDYYSTAIIAKKKGTVAEARWIDWGYMEKTNNAIFRDIIDVCNTLIIKPLMSFRHSWNTNVIAQFYATVTFEENESARKMHWMTEGTRYNVTFTHFVRYLGASPMDLTLPCIHRGNRPMEPSAMKFIYPRNKQANAGYAVGLYSYYSMLNRMFCLTLTPRGRNPADISNSAKDLLAHMRPPGLPFSVSDFVWEEIKTITASPQRLCGYAPYILHIIEKVSNRKFLKNTKHEPFKVPVPKRMRTPSLGRYDEVMEEGEGQQQEQYQSTTATGQDQTGLTGLETGLTGLGLAAAISLGTSHPLLFVSF